MSNINIYSNDQKEKNDCRREFTQMPLSAPLQQCWKFNAYLCQSVIPNTTHVIMNFLTRGVHSKAVWIKSTVDLLAVHSIYPAINELETSPCSSTIYVRPQTITLNGTNSACTKLTSVIKHHFFIVGRVPRTQTKKPNPTMHNECQWKDQLYQYPPPFSWIHACLKDAFSCGIHYSNLTAGQKQISPKMMSRKTAWAVLTEGMNILYDLKTVQLKSVFLHALKCFDKKLLFITKTNTFNIIINTVY